MAYSDALVLRNALRSEKITSDLIAQSTERGLVLHNRNGTSIVLDDGDLVALCRLRNILPVMPLTGPESAQDTYAGQWQPPAEFWENLPENFTAIAKDSTGQCCAYTSPPIRSSILPIWVLSRTGTCYIDIDPIIPSSVHWMDSLRTRPRT